MLQLYSHFFFFNDTATTEIYTLSLHDALPICRAPGTPGTPRVRTAADGRSDALGQRRHAGASAWRGRPACVPAAAAAGPGAPAAHGHRAEIGRASCRERG